MADRIKLAELRRCAENDQSVGPYYVLALLDAVEAAHERPAARAILLDVLKPFDFGAEREA